MINLKLLELTHVSILQTIGEFVLTHPTITLAPKGKSIYSLNEGYAGTWNEAVKEYVNNKKFPKVI